MVEASMMIKLNKDRIVRDPMMVKEFRSSWKTFIPKRPDDPADYYMNDQPEDENGDDGDGDISDEMNQGEMGGQDDSSIDSDDDELGLGS